MKKERMLALLQIAFFAVLIIMPACSGDVTCGDCGDCGDCNIDELTCVIGPAIDCEEICEVELIVTLPDGYCRFSSDLKLEDKDTGVVHYTDNGSQQAHTIENNIAKRTITLDPCVSTDITPAQLKEKYNFSIAAAGCRTIGCPDEQGKIMTLATSSTIAYTVGIKDCKVIWEVTLTESDFSETFPSCIQCCN